MKTVSTPSTRRPDARPPTKRGDGTGEATTPATSITAEQLHQMIAEEAYLRAEQRGFQQGDPSSDWLAAEAEITQRLAQNQEAVPRD
jgi:hypothetical protein